MPAQQDSGREVNKESPLTLFSHIAPQPKTTSLLEPRVLIYDAALAINFFNTYNYNCQIMSSFFDSKVAILVLDDLLPWQKLNVTAFLSTGIAASMPDSIGEPYENAAGRQFSALLNEPMLILAAQEKNLSRAYRIAEEKDLGCAAYVRKMFSTGHDAANREAFKTEPPDTPDLVGIAIFGPRKDVDKATKGSKFHQ